MGPIIMDLQGHFPDAMEREMLAHPSVGGLIFFSRNFHDVAQLKECVRQVRAASSTPLLLTVDHEGGRVQRFRDGFTLLPTPGKLAAAARALAVDEGDALAQMGWLMACELLACGIDLSFAPVTDLNGVSHVIGTRAFASDVDDVVMQTRHYIDGMRRAGMKSTGKHFPGHGSVVEDSHIAMPVDQRSFDEIYATDMAVFRQLISTHHLDAVMPAHVKYPQIDSFSAGFSSVWLQQILRQQLAFDGVIFSDDLGMHGASYVGGYAERSLAALNAGCDMILVCNNKDAAGCAIDAVPQQFTTQSVHRRQRLLMPTALNFSLQSDEYRAAVQLAARLNDAGAAFSPN